MVFPAIYKKAEMASLFFLSLYPLRFPVGGGVGFLYPPSYHFWVPTAISTESTTLFLFY